MAEASRDQNYVPTLTAASNADGTTPVKVYADPVTHRLLVDLPGGGSGDVTGPASATDNALVRFDGTTGKIIQSYTSNAIRGSDTGQLSVGPDTVLVGSNNVVAQFGANLNDYSLIYHQNRSAGDSASADLVLAADNDDATIAGRNLDLGFTSSGFVGTTAALGIVKTVSVTAGGTGYTVGNILTLATGDVNCQVQVLTAPAGVVATVAIFDNGTNYTTGTKATTGGSGTGCTINVLTLFDYSLFAANEGYIYTAGGNLSIGTDDTVAGRVIKFFTNGTATTNERARIADTGLQLGLTGTLTGALRFQGATSGTAILTVPTAAGTPTVTLPTTTGTLATLANTETFTNKRITERVGSTTSSATPTINTDTVDIYRLTAQAVDITSFTTGLTGTPTHGQNLIIEITGTAARAITWGASFEASTVALPTTTVTTNMLTVGFKWNSATSKWRCLATA